MLCFYKKTFGEFKMEKTNVMRILKQKNISYQAFEYPHQEGCFIDGAAVAERLNLDARYVFKTLVVHSAKQYYVFVIPVLRELDLKAAAKAVNEKKLDMLPLKDLLQVTGYVRGGCSPIGMKKAFKVIVDQSAEQLETMVFSAGKIGYQVAVKPLDLLKVVNGMFGDICQ